MKLHISDNATHRRAAPAHLVVRLPPGLENSPAQPQTQQAEHQAQQAQPAQQVSTDTGTYRPEIPARHPENEPDPMQSGPRACVSARAFASTPASEGSQQCEQIASYCRGHGGVSFLLRGDGPLRCAPLAVSGAAAAARML